MWHNRTVLELHLVFLLFTRRTCLHPNIDKHESCSAARGCNGHLQPRDRTFSRTFSMCCDSGIPLIFVSCMSGDMHLLSKYQSEFWNQTLAKVITMLKLKYY